MDFSDKGRDEFYKNWFEKVKGVEKDLTERTAVLKFKYLLKQVNNLQSYEHQREMYKIQLENFWKTKKSHLIICSREKEKYKGAVSLESREREETLKRQEKILKNMSESFKKDLEKLVYSDPDVRNYNLYKN